jgi:hypothetical protein
MKKIVVATFALLANLAWAGSVSIEGSKFNTIGGNDANGIGLTLNEDINKTFGVYAGVGSLQTVNTNTLSTRLEVGGTGTVPLFGSVTGYARLGLGQKFNNSGSFTYYQIEPGISVPLNDKVTARVGYRYRTAAERPTANKDTTDTLRIGASYAIDKVHSVGVRYDRIVGDYRQDVYSISYSHSF